MRVCVEHGLEVHADSFAYFNGVTASERKVAALRNVTVERELFGRHFLGNSAKAESHRVGHENSEDALTWNVFVELWRLGRLPLVYESSARRSGDECAARRVTGVEPTPRTRLRR